MPVQAVRAVTNSFDIVSVVDEHSRCVDRRQIKRLRGRTITSMGGKGMAQHRRYGGTALSIAVVIGAYYHAGAFNRALGQEQSPEVKAALRERDRLADQTRKLRAAGKLAEAITAAEAMLAIERNVFPPDHDAILSSLDRLASLHLEFEDFAAAKAARQEALAILRKRFGETHWKMVDARLALEDVERRAGMTHEEKQKWTEADRLVREIYALYRAGKYAEALSPARRSVALHKEILGERHRDYASSLTNLASLLRMQGDYAAARPLYEQALPITKNVLGDRHPYYATSINNLASLLKAQRDYTAAKPLYEQAMAIRKEALGERDPEYATSVNELADLLYAQGDYSAARHHYEHALAIRKEVLGERHPEYATSLNDLAILLEEQGEYAAARPLCEQALAIRNAALGDRHPDYAVSLNRLASLLTSQGDYGAARPLYEKAVAILKAAGRDRLRDYEAVLTNLAGLLQLQGDYAAARRLYEEALPITKDLAGERHPAYATSLSNLAHLLESEGDYAAARLHHEQALAIRKGVLGDHHPDYARSLMSLAELLRTQGDHAGARPLYEKAIVIFKEALGERHPDYATSLGNLALLLASEGDYAAARPLYEKNLAITRAALGERHPHYATGLNNLARLLREQGNDAAARPLFEQGLAIRKQALGEQHPDYALSLTYLAAMFHAQGDHAGAAPLLKQAIKISERNLGLAAAAQSERQQLAMIRALRWQLDAYLSLVPTATSSSVDSYSDVLASKGMVFEQQRRLHAQRRLLQADSQAPAARRVVEYEETIKQLATLALATPDPQKAQDWQARVAQLSRRKDDLETELALLDAGFRAERAKASRTPEQLQAALPSGTALVDLLVYIAYAPPARRASDFLAERRMVAFVVRPDRPIARVDLGLAAPIQKAIRDWRSVLVACKTGPAASESAQVVRWLVWELLEPHLEGITSVLISPDGPIGQIPLGALPGRDPAHYLIEERSIAVVPVPRLLAMTKSPAAPTASANQADGAARSLLLAGDIDYGGEPGKGGELAMTRSAATSARGGLLSDFKSLPETRGEILKIRDSFERRFPEGRAQTLRGDQATEEAVRLQAPRARYLHLATHGYFAPPELRSALGPAAEKTIGPGIDRLGDASVAGYHPGLLSGIALAGANRRPTPIGQDDGILTALEVAELDLSGVELAVLSACETGLGEVAGGEGLLGLQRAFQVAGVHSAVASLWSIGDEATEALMARFYDNLWTHGRPPAEALREAQLSMLRGKISFAGPSRGGLKREAGKPESDRLPPFYWAAFVLSTDRL
jgi:CHAT domain-containing protein